MDIHKPIIRPLVIFDKAVSTNSGVSVKILLFDANKNQIRSLEDRKDVQYINLDSFGFKTIKTITSNLFEFSYEKSNKDNSSDYEVEIRTLIDEKGGNSLDIFPEHYQTRVIGYKK